MKMKNENGHKRSETAWDCQLKNATQSLIRKIRRITSVDDMIQIMTIGNQL